MVRVTKHEGISTLNMLRGVSVIFEYQKVELATLTLQTKKRHAS